MRPLCSLSVKTHNIFHKITESTENHLRVDVRRKLEPLCLYLVRLKYEIYFDFYFLNWWVCFFVVVCREHICRRIAHTFVGYWHHHRRHRLKIKTDEMFSTKWEWEYFIIVKLFTKFRWPDKKTIVLRRINTIFEESIEFNCYYLPNRCHH